MRLKTAKATNPDSLQRGGRRAALPLSTVKAIDARSREARADGRSIEDLDSEPARRMALKDLDDIRELKTPERLDDAAVVIHGNMRNPAYKAEFERAGFVTPEALPGQGDRRERNRHEP